MPTTAEWSRMFFCEFHQPSGRRESKSLERLMAAIRQMGRRWFLMVPGMSGREASGCLFTVHHQSRLMRQSQRRGEEEEEKFLN